MLSSANAIKRFARSFFSRKPAAPVDRPRETDSRRMQLTCEELENRIVPTTYNYWNWIQTGAGVFSSNDPGGWTLNGASTSSSPSFGGYDEINIPATNSFGVPTSSIDLATLDSPSAYNQVVCLNVANGYTGTVYADDSLIITGNDPQYATSVFWNSSLILGRADGAGELTIGSHATFDLPGLTDITAPNHLGIYDFGTINVAPSQGSTVCSTTISASTQSVTLASSGVLNVTGSTVGASLTLSGSDYLQMMGPSFLSLTGTRSGAQASLTVGGYLWEAGGSGGNNPEVVIGKWSGVTVNGSWSTGDSNFPTAGVGVFDAYLVMTSVNDSGTTGMPSLTASNGVYFDTSSVFTATLSSTSSAAQNATINGAFYAAGTVAMQNNGYVANQSFPSSLSVNGNITLNNTVIQEYMAGIVPTVFVTTGSYTMTINSTNSFYCYFNTAGSNAPPVGAYGPVMILGAGGGVTITGSITWQNSPGGVWGAGLASWQDWDIWN